MLEITKEISEIYEGASIGLMVMEQVTNASYHKELDLMKNRLEEELQERYQGVPRNELKSMHPMDVYTSYYKKFGYNYHVQLQLESIISGKKTIPFISSLVVSMFMAELKNMLLTAGCDFSKIQLPLQLKAADGTESYTGMNGKELITVAGDMMLNDSGDMMSSILRGPDLKTSIRPGTNQVLFIVYAPPGIGEELIDQHLKDIETYIKIASPEAVLKERQVYKV
ncbi:MAG: hypothetical protein N2484_05670 [Clostridia bacterium]|nr:hypothetical protein [Clostridia bacterium]